MLKQIFSPRKQRPPIGGVRQDKTAPKRGRVASLEPAPLPNGARARRNTGFAPQMKTNIPRDKRIQKYSGQRTVHVSMWVDVPVKEELCRIAKQEGLSVSRVAGCFIEQALRQNLSRQQADLFAPLLAQTVRQSMRVYSARIAALLVRNAYSAEQTRVLVTNLLSRQQGVTEAMLNEILDGSSTVAKRTLGHKTPQLTALIGEVEQWLAKEAEEHA